MTKIPIVGIVIFYGKVQLLLEICTLLILETLEHFGWKIICQSIKTFQHLKDCFNHVVLCFLHAITMEWCAIILLDLLYDATTLFCFITLHGHITSLFSHILNNLSNYKKGRRNITIEWCKRIMCNFKECLEFPFAPLITCVIFWSQSSNKIFFNVS